MFMFFFFCLTGAPLFPKVKLDTELIPHFEDFGLARGLPLAETGDVTLFFLRVFFCARSRRCFGRVSLNLHSCHEYEAKLRKKDSKKAAKVSWHAARSHIPGGASYVRT